MGFAVTGRAGYSNAVTKTMPRPKPPPAAKLALRLQASAPPLADLGQGCGSALLIEPQEAASP